MLWMENPTFTCGTLGFKQQQEMVVGGGNMGVGVWHVIYSNLIYFYLKVSTQCHDLWKSGVKFHHWEKIHRAAKNCTHCQHTILIVQVHIRDFSIKGCFGWWHVCMHMVLLLCLLCFSRIFLLNFT